ncbi:hypothetical protein [Flavobacterium granuli]|uniref:Uncharacterized protein n=1 Tax=Flavobacterium granuli TaxID=280093 RepID=A0ABU1S0P6_9FLAO|nr:hypothetical protein [Flavobacterium granuli]MDR6844482.1 hypothetical protein [Flavobacterium granuli]
MNPTFLEVRTALRSATKHDLFTGNVNEMHAVQGIKENVTVFYLDEKTKAISGPYNLHEGTNFMNVFIRMTWGLCGVITPIPKVVSPTDFIFDLVLREASLDDVKYNSKNVRLHLLYYTYASQVLSGPFYIDDSTTSLYLENLVSKKQIFIPNERQHFRKKEYKKAG